MTKSKTKTKIAVPVKRQFEALNLPKMLAEAERSTRAIHASGATARSAVPLDQRLRSRRPAGRERPAGQAPEIPGLTEGSRAAHQGLPYR